jgi:hypothetical protein
VQEARLTATHAVCDGEDDNQDGNEDDEDVIIVQETISYLFVVALMEYTFQDENASQSFKDPAIQFTTKAVFLLYGETVEVSSTSVVDSMIGGDMGLIPMIVVLYANEDVIVGSVHVSDTYSL